MGEPESPPWEPWLSTIAERLNLAPYVRWDRFVFYGERLLVYGWIDREDGRSDFALGDFTLSPSGTISASSLTSSVERSREFTNAMWGFLPDQRVVDEHGRELHVECLRVEDEFERLVDNVAHAEGWREFDD